MISHAARLELSALWRLALPLVVGQVLLFSTTVVATLLAGHLDPLVLGSVAIGGSLWSLPLMGLQGIMFSVPASVSHLCGAGRRGEVGALFRQALFMSASLGILVLVVLRFGADLFVPWMRLQPDIAIEVAAFLRAVALGAPALALFMVCRGLSDGLSHTRPAMWFGLLGLPLQGLFGYLLMFGPFGLPRLGAAGSGYATALETWIGAICFLTYVARGRGYRGIGWGRGPKSPHWRAIRDLLALGLPMGLNVMLESSLFSFAAVAIGQFGATQISAHQIALNVAGLSFMVPLGMAGAITVRVGHAMGRADLPGARRAGLIGICLALATQTIAMVVILAFPWTIASLYSPDPGVQAATVALLALAGLFQLSDGMQVAANGALRGMKDTRWPLLITLLAYWGVGMPIGMALAFPGGWEARGMWVGLLMGLTVAAGLLTWRFRRRTLAAMQHGVTLVT